MTFHRDAIDLLKTTQAYRDKCGKGPEFKSYFGLEVVRLADGLLGGYGPNPEEVAGIRKCLLYQTFRLKRRGPIRRFLGL